MQSRHGPQPPKSLRTGHYQAPSQPHNLGLQLGHLAVVITEQFIKQALQARHAPHQYDMLCFQPTARRPAPTRRQGRLLPNIRATWAAHWLA